MYVANMVSNAGAGYVQAVLNLTVTYLGHCIADHVVYHHLLLYGEEMTIGTLVSNAPHHTVGDMLLPS